MRHSELDLQPAMHTLFLHTLPESQLSSLSQPVMQEPDLQYWPEPHWLLAGYDEQPLLPQTSPEEQSELELHFVQRRSLQTCPL